MVTILSVIVVVLALIVVGLTYSYMGMKEQLETFDKEQHTQNTDIINLMKHHIKNQDVFNFLGFNNYKTLTKFYIFV